MRTRGLTTVLILPCLWLVIAGGQPRAQKTTGAAAGDLAARPTQPDWATLVGSVERNKYHRPACGIAQRIKSENVIWFIDANDATEGGYVAAGCNDRKCRPPAPDRGVETGPIGGSGLPAPSLNPPEIPKPSDAPETATKGNVSTSAVATTKKRTGQPKAAAAKSTAPPRMAPRRGSTSAQVWQDVPPQRELAARKDWDVWAAWALERWCERWHVAPSGKIASNAAYSPDAERQLMARFAEMKEMIAQNKKRMTELEAAIAGKKK